MRYDTNKFTQHIKQAQKRLKRYIERDAPRIVGTEAKNHYRQSFDKEGFTNKSLQKWKPPKRTNPESKWYGFSYRARTPLPGNHPRRRGAKRKYRQRKSNPITNYSRAATRRKTLSGETGDLKESIDYTPQKSKVIIHSDQDYAQVHNEGGKIKVFGGKTVQLPQRQFMGQSAVLDEKIRREIDRDIDKILE